MKYRTTVRALVAVLALALVGCAGKQAEDTASAEEQAKLEQRLERLSKLEVPPDGQALGNFMLREIPDVIAEVPCVCCNKTLDKCYTGDCPPM